jgi:hypothetical protein
VIGSFRLQTRVLRCVALVLTIALAGCYTYVPAAAPPTERGSRVRVNLADPAELRLANVTANDVVTVTGDVIHLAEDSLALSAWELRSASGFEHLASGETVRIERDNIAGLERRKLSALRSALVTGALVLGGALFFAVVGGGDNGGEGPRNPPPPTQ